ncbi:TetR/AcrR family transcriptional regulator [Knoellia subterranea]|uniref:TetR family transcriptional regulator n=1 Tax=Knoellia subterranea KCTC 19937 TaxID=1385521 RepID=A0A0A0JU53_9MICO|nr:TetR/AcrR family transcriptional regulator [Knoellia subterranea]KGN39201.1 TetR family transcriptional regulator [Knoellia subterranea KCTC 19937]
MSATTGTPLSEQSILATLEDSGDTAGATAVRLMIAAADAFSQKGFHATTTRDIASRAGLSPAGVYVHFSSKEDLLFQLSRRGHQTARDQLVAAAARADSPTEALRRIISGFSTWHAEHHQLGRIVQYEFRHLTPEHRDTVLALRREIDKVVRDVLADGVESGEFDVEDISATALALLSMAVDVARWYSPQIRRTPEEIGETNGDLAVRLVTRG